MDTNIALDGMSIEKVEAMADCRKEFNRDDYRRAIGFLLTESHRALNDLKEKLEAAEKDIGELEGDITDLENDCDDMEIERDLLARKLAVVTTLNPELADSQFPPTFEGWLAWAQAQRESQQS